MLKRILGLCECPGCKRFAKTNMIIKSKDGNIKELHVCQDCAWLIRMDETKIEFRRML